MIVTAADKIGSFVIEGVDGIEVLPDGFKSYFTDGTSKIYKGCSLLQIFTTE